MPRNRNTKQDEGIALVVTLAFVVLLTVLVVAFSTRVGSHRAVAKSAFSETKADQLAQSALAIIVGNLKQEITDAPTVTSGNVLPQHSGTPAPGLQQIPNLIRISFQDEATGTAPIPAPGVASRASRVNSTAASLNGRSVTSARWNSHYLIPRASTSTTLDSTPISSFNAPDWVLVTANGPEVLSPPAQGVIGRYAFAIYNEGGLLDVNVSGFPYSPPSPTPAATPGIPDADVGRKGTVACADLRGLPTSPTVITSSSGVPSSTSWFPAPAANDLIGWRNYVTVAPGGSFTNFTFDPSTQSPGTGSRFLGIFLNTVNGFLTTATSSSGGKTDQSIVSRGELLELRSSIGFSQSLLQYLGTFSRDTNHSTWSDSARRLASRFPLGRFDYLNTPSTKANEIKRYFAVEYVPASGPTAEHWKYTGAESSTMQSSIHVLTGEGQDPDLSVLLRYAYPSSVSDGEILSIIASLIDQRDDTSHADTTWIEYGDPAAPTKAWGLDTNAATDATAPTRPTAPVFLNRALRNVGELGYAYRSTGSGYTPLDFKTTASVDARLLDLFTFNTALTRAGLVDLNTGNIAVLTAVLMGATISEGSSTYATRTDAFHAAQNISTEINRQNAIGRADITRLVNAAASTLGSTDEAKQAVARGLAEVTQTRTWNLMIDVVAQAGRYPLNAASLANFVVEGEKRYWLHIAIDRFTNQIIDQQLEAVFE